MIPAVKCDSPLSDFTLLPSTFQELNREASILEQCSRRNVKYHKIHKVLDLKCQDKTWHAHAATCFLFMLCSSEGDQKWVCVYHKMMVKLQNTILTSPFLWFNRKKNMVEEFTIRTNHHSGHDKNKYIVVTSKLMFS